MTGPTCEPPGQYCKQTYDCPYFHKCSAERCVLVVEGAACVAPGDCGKAQYCDDLGQCKNFTVVDFDCSPEYTVCAPGSECHWPGSHYSDDPNAMLCFSLEQNMGFCDYGIIPCASSHYCPTFVDEYSDPPLCKKRGGLGEPCIDEEPSSCLAGLSCNFYECQPAAAPDGTRCEAEVMVWEAPYWRDYDEDAELPCAAGSYCKGLEYNQALQLEGICTPLKQVGEECTMNYQCGGSYCNDGRCTAPTLGSRCGNPDVCPSGTICTRQGRSAQYWPDKCVKALAIGEACGQGIEGLCELGARCDAPYQQVGVCREVVQQGDDCSDAVCAAGSFCIENP